MSSIYDNWERLVEATLKREHLRELALCESFSSMSSDFSVDSFPEDVAEASGFPSKPSNLSYSDQSSSSSLPTQKAEILSPNPKLFSFNELKYATRNFDHLCLLGRGASACVYKGWINEHTLIAAKTGDRLVVAVKKLKLEKFQDQEKWLREVYYLGQLCHPNLVKLIGYCSEGDNRILVCEFMPNGSLSDHLPRRGDCFVNLYLPMPFSIITALVGWRPMIFAHALLYNVEVRENLCNLINSCILNTVVMMIMSVGFEPALSWNTRIDVAIGIARGLSFLHDRDSELIHGDVNSSNILLDMDFNAKLSGFPLAKRPPRFGVIPRPPVRNHSIISPSGLSYGYKAPEYVLRGELTTKCDVYSFGVVLIELLTGGWFMGDKHLERWRWMGPCLMLEHKSFGISMDAELEDQYPREEAYKVVSLVSLCVSSDPKERPCMKEVLGALEKMRGPKTVI